MNTLATATLIWLCMAVEGFKVLSKRPLRRCLTSSMISRTKHQNNTSIDYWERPDIHTLGNTGVGGSLHANVAPLVTKLIDLHAYKGKDVRSIVSKDLKATMKKTGARIADLCCGVGMSTRALESAFSDAELIVGFDASAEMIKKANSISNCNQATGMLLPRLRHWLRSLLRRLLKRNQKQDIRMNTKEVKVTATYRVVNSEHVPLPDHSFDLVTIMFAFHEIPIGARELITHEARRILKSKGILVILDIDPTYMPPKSMLAGEPYIQEYRHNIDRQLAVLPGFSSLNRNVVVPGHVISWTLTKS